MNLSQEVLAHILTRGECRVRIEGPHGEPLSELVEGECCRALTAIRAVLADDSLDDPACFRRIEAIVRALEEAGVSCGSRHDFG